MDRFLLVMAMVNVLIGTGYYLTGEVEKAAYNMAGACFLLLLRKAD